MESVDFRSVLQEHSEKASGRREGRSVQELASEQRCVLGAAAGRLHEHAVVRAAHTVNHDLERRLHRIEALLLLSGKTLQGAELLQRERERKAFASNRHRLEVLSVTPFWTLQWGQGTLSPNDRVKRMSEEKGQREEGEGGGHVDARRPT